MIGGIDALHVTTPERDDNSGNGICMLGSNQEVNLVGREHIGVKRELLFVQQFGQPVQVSVSVFFAKEAGFAVMSTLHNVQRCPSR